MKHQFISLFLVNFEARSRNIFSYANEKSLSGADCIGLQHSLPRLPLLLAILLTEMGQVTPIVGQPYQYRYNKMEDEIWTGPEPALWGLCGFSG